MTAKMRFQPVSHSWVALHPQPKGVIQFIGGAFFGTFFPMFFYRYLLESLFKNGYTIILLPFNFTFNHYVEAGFLIKEQYEIIPELVRMAQLANYDYKIYLKDTNFSWIGHSIGCKYIALLEGFTALPEDHKELEKVIRQIVVKSSDTSDKAAIERKIQSILSDIETLMYELRQETEKATNLSSYYVGEEKNIFSSLFIKGQTSILLAPVNSGTDSAIPKPLAKIIDKLGLGVNPNPQETFALIQETNLFNLLGLIQFKADKLAKSTVDWFLNTFNKPPVDFQYLAPGGHLKPLGLQVGNSVINFPDSLPIIESTQKRNAELESYVIKLLQALEKKR
ncbi:DUF1350 family protein [Nostoc sp. CMAA1605]|uniref:DUF1350 family protein n=1 Tax=Nostoc sp. CMAA1605 TaxID=2055159 RepID=UPI001F4599E2|nr:DUF1350 family protein [Nostoc sp. CMAA1605]MCF4970139.1 hypothetical protein [Nostoc sp. CMAA1605]